MLLQGKTALIVGVANKRSIAWGIAEAFHREGARLAFNYQGERLKENVEGLAAGIPGSVVFPCDVTRDSEIDALFANVRAAFGRLDVLVHCVAFAKKEDLEGAFSTTSRDGFGMALDISAYSLTALAQRAAALMEGGGSIVALTYLGAERVVPKYNVMGVAKAALESSIRYLAYDLGSKNIRVNGISAGPINTLAARGIAGFTSILQHVRERSPLPRNTEPAEVGDTAVFLCSDMGRGITGEVIYVDNGFHIMGT
ncbi:MAG TPA: enoyl-ACP reductase [Patescibacteria group bacterium]|nr:enoyl-ACP reductase [Patescibacteria group bacterium]